MNLLILTTVYPRGQAKPSDGIIYGKFVHDFAVEWARQGHTVHVLTPHSIQTLPAETLDGVRVHRFHYFFKTDWETLTYGDGIPQNIRRFKNKLLVPPLAAAFWWQALRLVRQYQIDVLNAHWVLPGGLVGLAVRAITGVSLVVTAYGAELFPVLAGRMTWLKPFLAMTLRRADVVAGISYQTVQAAKTLSRRADIHRLPDGIDTDYYRPAPKSAAIVQKYGLGGKSLIFFAGRMVERKGHRTVLEAMAAVRRHHPDARLILGGKGPLFDDLRRRRAELSLEDVVILPGFLPEADMVPLLQTADAFVLPSCIDAHGDTEGSATAALEAMACGTPAVISRVGGNIDAIEDGRGAFYFEPNNAADLAGKICALLDDPVRRAKLAVQARTFIETHYAWPELVKRYETIIEQTYAR